jgi:hypothetical protein
MSEMSIEHLCRLSRGTELLIREEKVEKSKILGVEFNKIIKFM